MKSWIVVDFGDGFDFFASEDGKEKEHAEVMGGTLVEICGTKEAAMRSIRALENPKHPSGCTCVECHKFVFGKILDKRR